MEKYYENLKIFLQSILIAGWGVNCSPSFANFPGLGGEVSPVSPPPPGAATALNTKGYFEGEKIW